MRTRSVLVATLAAAALSVAVPAAAQAKTTEILDRGLFDGTPERTASTLHLEGLTRGPLDSYLDVTFTAKDGTLPTTFGSCEAVDVAAVLTPSPGENLAVVTDGEACAHIVDGTLQVNAAFDEDDLTYSGTAHKKVKLIGEGLIGAAHQQFGGLASFFGQVRW